MNLLGILLEQESRQGGEGKGMDQGSAPNGSAQPVVSEICAGVADAPPTWGLPRERKIDRNMNLADLIGAVAGALTTIAYLPQVIKIWKSKSVKDISILTFSTLWTGIFLWAVYGLLIASRPVFIANVVSLGLISTILYLKIRHR